METYNQTEVVVKHLYIISTNIFGSIQENYNYHFDITSSNVMNNYDKMAILW